MTGSSLFSPLSALRKTHNAFEWDYSASVWRLSTALRKFCTVILICATAAVVLSACTSPPKKPTEAAAPIVFPSAPEEPRFYFETTLMNSAQVNKAQSMSEWRRALTGETEGGEYLSKPFDVTACRGVVYVSDTVQRRVLVFDFPRQRYFKLGDRDPGMLMKPLGVASDEQCRVYVVDATLRQVLVYDAEGKYLSSIGEAEGFRHISHVAVDPAGEKAYIVDTGGVESRDHRIRVYETASGRHVRDIGSRGNEAGQLNLPRDIALTRDGQIYVVDGGNFRIQVFKTDGTFVRTFGAMGAQFGQFTRPKGIAVDGAGNVYVADAAFGNFQIFDPSGALLLFIGERSNSAAPAKYMLPAGIDVDRDGRVYFVDQFFRKVDVFRPAGLGPKEGDLARRPGDPPASVGSVK